MLASLTSSLMFHDSVGKVSCFPSCYCDRVLSNFDLEFGLSEDFG